MKQINKRVKKVSIVGVVVAFIVIVIFVFFLQINSLYNKKVKQLMRDSCYENSVIINNNIDDIFHLLHITGEMVSTYDVIYDDDVLNMLDSISDNYDFTRMTVITKNGVGYTSDGYIDQYNDRDYYIKSLNEENAVSGFLKSKIDGNGFIAFSHPIYRNGDVIGVISCTVHLDFFNDLVKNNKTYDSKDVLIINSGGTILTSNFLNNKTENYYDILNDSKLEDNDILYRFEDNLINKVGEFIEYEYNSEDIYAYYQPLGVNDWFIITTKSKDLIDKDTNEIINSFILVLVVIILSFFVLLMYLYDYQRKVYKKIKLDEERYRIISELSEDIIFEYYIDKKTIVLSQNAKKIFGKETEIENFQEKLVSDNYIYSSDLKIYNEFFDNVCVGDSNNEAVFRIKNKLNNYIWYKIIAQTIYDKNKVPLKVIGKMHDVDSDMREKEFLQEQLKRDSLTGLYNKLAIKSLIKKYIYKYPNDNCAFIYIDIDDFKQLNDKFGRENGDKILLKMVEMIKPMFRSSDIIGRVGDDEFVIFLKNIRSKVLLLNKINGIQEIVKKLYIDNDLGISISSSIGISLYPEDADNYKELYQKAGIALYRAKSKGKDCYKFFREV